MNGKLVALHFAKSTGPESKRELLPRKAATVPDLADPLLVADTDSDRYDVKMYELISPSEFYVIGDEDEGQAERNMHKEIQSFVENSKLARANEKPLAVDSKCFVFHEDAWHRAEICALSSNNSTYKVVLCDTNQLVAIEAHNVAELPKSFYDKSVTLIKCELANLVPSAGRKTWTAAAIDWMDERLKAVTRLAVEFNGVSMNTAHNVNPVTLYGYEFLNCSQRGREKVRGWFSFNEQMHNFGLAAMYRFKPAADAYSPSTIDELADLVAAEEAEKAKQKERDASLKEQFKMARQIKAWLPAKKLTKTIFSGVPTNIDTNGIVYVHDSTQADELKELREDIKAYVETYAEETTPKQHVYQVGEPCLAEFYLDSNWYRAVVINKVFDSDADSVKYAVQFVDYGNIDRLSTDKMISQVIHYDVPILCHKFRLSGEFLQFFFSLSKLEHFCPSVCPTVTINELMSQ